MGVPQVIIYFHGIFPNKNHPAIGVPPGLRKPPYPQQKSWRHCSSNDLAQKDVEFNLAAILRRRPGNVKGTFSGRLTFVDPMRK